MVYDGILQINLKVQIFRLEVKIHFELVFVTIHLFDSLNDCDKTAQTTNPVCMKTFEITYHFWIENDNEKWSCS